MTQPTPSSSQALPAATLKILVLDSKPQSRSILKGSLLSLDIVGMVMERGSTAALVELMEKEGFDLVLVERELGTQRGALDLIWSLRERPALQKTRYVIVDQHVDDAVRQEAGGMGVTGFLNKPFDLQTLEQSLWEGMGSKVRPSPPVDSRSGTAAVGRARIPQDVLDRLKRVDVFAAFTDAELVRLLKICQFRRIPAGQYIFQEGDRGDRLYVLISGQVDIKHLKGAEAKVLDVLMPGDCFGEMAIIDSGPRSAHAQAASDVMVIEVMEETINGDDDAVAVKMVRQLAKLLTQRIRKLMVRVK